MARFNAVANSARMTVGYLRTLVRKHAPFAQGGDQLADIFNYLQLDQRLASSGQPTEQQFRRIAESGYEQVINLLPADTENSLPGEAELVGSLGMTYVHIPVDFAKPGEAEFDRFAAEMEAAGGRKLWVHCAANARVSCFIYRYRTQVLGVPTAEAREDLDRMWHPVGVWARFIEPGN